MAFSRVPPGRTQEAACNEAPYLVAEGEEESGGVTRGQLGGNNESFFYLSISVSSPPPFLLLPLLPVRTVAHQVTFWGGRRSPPGTLSSNLEIQTKRPACV